MSNETLQQTIAAVQRETQIPSTQQKIETPQATSQDQASETNTGETQEPEYVSGIDISDVPVEDRPRIKELLSKKAGLLEKGYQPKFQKVAALDKALTDLTSRGLDLNEAQTVLNDYIQKKQNPQGLTQQEKKNVKKLDELLNQSSIEQRSAFEDLRRITQEEAGDSPSVIALKKQLDDMQKIVSSMQGRDFSTAQQKAQADLDGLKGKFGNDLIERHKENILGEWSKYPNTQVKDILKYVVPDEEYEQAILSSRKQTQSQTIKEKINAISSAGSGITSTKENLNPKMKWKDFMREVVKK